MPIKVTCKCGQSFAAKDQLAGKAVKCPNCAQPIRIPKPKQKPAAGQPSAAPASGGIGDLLDEVGMAGHEHDEYKGPRCPSCDAPLAHNAVLCVECGFRLETGRFVGGAGAVASPSSAVAQAEGYEGAAERLLEKADHSLADDAIQELKMRAQGMPIWLIATLLVTIMASALAVTVLPAEMPEGKAYGLPQATCGWVLVLVFEILILVSAVWLTVIAFIESWVCGLMFMFVPFYWLYYVITRWYRCSRLFNIWLVSNLVQGVAGVFFWWATWRDDSGWWPWSQDWDAAGEGTAAAAVMILAVLAPVVVVIIAWMIQGFIFMLASWLFNKIAGGPDAPKAVRQPDLGDAMMVILGGVLLTYIGMIIGMLIMSFAAAMPIVVILGLIIYVASMLAGPLVFTAYSAKELLPTTYGRGILLTLLYNLFAIPVMVVLMIPLWLIIAAIIAAYGIGVAAEEATDVSMVFYQGWILCWI